MPKRPARNILETSNSGKLLDRDSVNKRLTRAGIVAAQMVTPAVVDAEASFGPFEMNSGGARPGLWKTRKGDDPLWVSAHFEALAETRGPDGTAWGILLRWRDADGLNHQSVVARKLLCGDGTPVRELLADGGLRLGSSPVSKASLIEYLDSLRISARVRTVTRVGWQALPEGQIYAFPEETIGASSELAIMDTAGAIEHAFHTGGTLDEWKTGIAARCVGSPVLVVSVCLALAAPLLELVGEDDGGINLRGGSRQGNSTAQRVAASVFGGSPRNGAGDLIGEWRSTGGGLEARAALSNDAPLILSELGAADARILGALLYMLAAGVGKETMTRTRQARPQTRWRTLFLSSGEIGVADKFAEVGETLRAGQEVRCVDVPSDAGAGWGVFGHLHDASTPGALAERLSAATRHQYGTAARAFIRHLVTELRTDASGVRAALCNRLDTIAARLLADDVDAGGQARTVARRFGPIALAGELASEIAITGWQPGLPTDAAGVLFEAWRRDRGGSGAREDLQAVRQLRRCISIEGSLHFETWHERIEPDEQAGSAPAFDRVRPAKRLGFKRERRDRSGEVMFTHYLTSEGLEHATAGPHVGTAKAALVERGLIKVDNSAGKMAGVVTPVPGYKRLRLYEVTAKVYDLDDV